MAQPEGYTGLGDVSTGEDEVFGMHDDPADPDFGAEVVDDTPGAVPKMKIANPVIHPPYSGDTPAMRVSEPGFSADRGVSQ